MTTFNRTPDARDARLRPAVVPDLSAASRASRPSYSSSADKTGSETGIMIEIPAVWPTRISESPTTGTAAHSLPAPHLDVTTTPTLGSFSAPATGKSPCR